jgi:hypothetical protein
MSSSWCDQNLILIVKTTNMRLIVRVSSICGLFLFAKIEAHLQTKKPVSSTLTGFIYMEMRGVEPLSKRTLSPTSTLIVKSFKIRQSQTLFD